MNYSELTVAIGKQTFPLYLQPGFFNTDPTGPRLHKHRYTEIHLIAEGQCEYLIGSQKYLVEPGQALAIPAGVFHQCITAEQQAKKTAFQIPIPLKDPLKKTLLSGLVQKIIQNIEQTEAKSSLSAMLALVCSEFVQTQAQIQPLRDPAFIIHERLANEYYMDLSLEDIATDLKLSRKQTERLIVKHTGNTFRNEIARRRIEAARHLLATEDITLAEAAERVGYKSYSGFWKAFKEKKA